MKKVVKQVWVVKVSLTTMNMANMILHQTTKRVEVGGEVEATAIRKSLKVEAFIHPNTFEQRNRYDRMRSQVKRNSAIAINKPERFSELQTTRKWKLPKTEKILGLYDQGSSIMDSIREKWGVQEF
jgi:hypothetical protein